MIRLYDDFVIGKASKKGKGRGTVTIELCRCKCLPVSVIREQVVHSEQEGNFRIPYLIQYKMQCKFVKFSLSLIVKLGKRNKLLIFFAESHEIILILCNLFHVALMIDLYILMDFE